MTHAVLQLDTRRSAPRPPSTLVAQFLRQLEPRLATGTLVTYPFGRRATRVGQVEDWHRDYIGVRYVDRYVVRDLDDRRLRTLAESQLARLW